MKSNRIMPKHTLILYLLGALLLCLPLTTTAQTADAQFERQMQAQAEPMHFVSLLFLRNPTVKTSQYQPAISLFYTSEEKDFRINAYPGTISRAIRYDGPNEFVLFDKQFNEEGEEVRIPKVRIDLGPPGLKMVVLTTNSEDKLLGKVIRTDERSFPENTVRIFNFCAQPVKAEVQNVAKDIPKMGLDDFQVKMDGPRAMVGFTVVAYDDGEGYLVARKPIGMSNGSRKFIVLFPNPKKPDRLTYTNLSINTGPFYGNFSDEEVSTGDSEYRDSYVPAAQR